MILFRFSCRSLMVVHLYSPTLFDAFFKLSEAIHYRFHRITSRTIELIFRSFHNIISNFFHSVFTTVKIV